MRDILAWALATEILGLAVLPLLRVYFRNRRDAALLARPVGLAVVAYLGWALSLVSRLGFERVTLMLVTLAVGGACWLARRRSADETMRAKLWGDEEKLAALVFWGATGVFLVIRAAVPGILGQEKFMDLAFLNALARRPEMPPVDPWMAGKTVNYYYWGYLLAAAQAKLSGVSPMAAYNLAVASFAGFSFAAAACLGFRLSRGDLKVGLGGAALTVFAGNFSGALDAWNAPFARDFDYFHASRVIEAGNTINEFPFFTFFHADLHPHLLAFPYFVAAFAMAHRALEAGMRDALKRWPLLLLLALVAGTARAASLWNMPALAILFVFCGALWAAGGQRLPRPGPSLLGALAGAGLFLVSMVLFYPYTASFQLENRGMGRTTLFSGALEFLGVWGILFAVAAVGLWPRPEAPAGEDEAARRRRDFRAALAAAAAVLAGLLLKMPAMPILLLLALLALRAGWRSLRAPEGDGEGVFAAFLVLLALGMIGGCELVYFKDTYGAELQRMNTIFKFYHQAWPLLAIGGAVFAGRAWDAAAGRRRKTVRAVLTAAAALALLWPLNATVSRLRQKDGPFTLDGAERLRQRAPGDAAAIDWLMKNASRKSVLLEASGDPYGEFSRIASHTGIPTVMGWANHEGLWRAGEPEVMERLQRVNHFYTTPDPRVAWETIGKYGITHVVVGDLERRTYPNAAAVARFPFLAPVFTGDTTIFQVVRPE